MYQLRSRYPPIYELPSACKDIQPFRSTKVKMLLERNDVDPNIASEHGQTPLYVAAWKGREKVVKELLERGDVNPNTPDNFGSFNWI